MSSHGRRRQDPGPGPRPGPGASPAQSARRSAQSPPVGPSPVGPSPVGPAQLGWALLVIAAALIGGLAAATLVHTSLTIAVIVSVVAGGIAVLAAFRSPARPPELGAGGPAQAPQAPQPQRAARGAPPAQATQPPWADPPAPGAQAVPPASFASPASDPTVPVPAETDGQARGGPPAGHQTVVQLLPLPPQPGNAEPPDAPWWDSAQASAARRVRAPSGRPLRTCPPTWRPPLSRSARAAARSGSTSGGPGVPGISAVRPVSTPGPGSLVHRGRRFGSCPGGEGSDVRSRPPAP